jgi:hypothetical protein
VTRAGARSSRHRWSTLAVASDRPSKSPQRSLRSAGRHRRGRLLASGSCARGRAGRGSGRSAAGDSPRSRVWRCRPSRTFRPGHRDSLSPLRFFAAGTGGPALGPRPSALDFPTRPVARPALAARWSKRAAQHPASRSSAAQQSLETSSVHRREPGAFALRCRADDRAQPQVSDVPNIGGRRRDPWDRRHLPVIMRCRRSIGWIGPAPVPDTTCPPMTGSNAPTSRAMKSVPE